jgi:hypothetical protein
MTWEKLFFSWQTKLAAIFLAVWGVAQAFIGPGKDQSIGALFMDRNFQFALLGAAAVWLTKYRNAHGTQDAPIPPVVAAALLASIPPTVLAPSPVGGLVPGSKHVFFAVSGDQNPVGYLYSAPDGMRYLKITATTYEMQ